MKTRSFAGVLAVAGAVVLFGAYQHGNKANAQNAFPASNDPTTSINGNPVTSTEPPPPAGSDVGSPGESAPEPLAPQTLSPAVAEVVKLVQAGVDEDVIATYVKNSSQPFNPSADEILYLNDLGISDKVMAALVQHQPTPTGGQPDVAPAAPPEQPVTPPPSNVAAAPAANPDYVTVPPPPSQVPGTTTTTTTTTTVADVLPTDPPQQQTVSYFYDSLSPYGAWVDVPDYGMCWRPTVAVINPGWRPYCDHGHWVYSDCGWYWASDYSWGWAAFHYGRWCPDARFGWVWVPHHVWGPSWVSWRSTPEYCGWAPLPPAARFRPGVGFVYHSASVSVGFDFGLTFSAYTFIPVGHFCDPHPWQHRVAAAQVHNVFNHSTVVNHYTVNKTTIINEGIGRERIARASSKPIPTVAVHEAPANSRVIVRGDKARQVGRDMVVYRPPTSAVTAAPRRPVQPAVNAAAPHGTQHTAQNHQNPAPGRGDLPLVQAPPTSGVRTPVQHPTAQHTGSPQGNVQQSPAHQSPAQQANTSWSQNHAQTPSPQPATAARTPVVHNNNPVPHATQPAQSHAATAPKINSPVENNRNQPSGAASSSSTEKYSSTSRSYYTPPYETPRRTTPPNNGNPNAGADKRVWGSEGKTFGGADLRSQGTPRQSGAAAAAAAARSNASNGARRSENSNGKSHN